MKKIVRSLRQRPELLSGGKLISGGVVELAPVGFVT